MKFSQETLREGMATALVGAMSFVMEADVEVGLEEPALVKKVLSTETYSVTGLFAAGEIDGTIAFTAVCKDGVANVHSLTVKFSDVDAETVCQCETEQDLLAALTNAHQMYITRKRTQGKRYEKINQCCDQLSELVQTMAKKHQDKVNSIIQEIRNQVG